MFNVKLQELVLTYKILRDAKSALELAEYIANNYDNLSNPSYLGQTTLHANKNTPERTEQTTLVMTKPDLPPETLAMAEKPPEALAFAESVAETVVMPKKPPENVVIPEDPPEVISEDNSFHVQMFHVNDFKEKKSLLHRIKSLFKKGE